MILIIAGFFEVGFTTCMKLSENFTIWKWTVGFFVCAIISFYLLSKAIETIPIGTGYAVWTGIGAVGTVLIGILFFDEPTDFKRMFFIFLLIASIIGLRVVSLK